MPQSNPDLAVDAGGEVIAASLRAHGCTVVRRLFDPTGISAIRERFRHRFAQLDSLGSGVYYSNLPIAFGDANAETIEIEGRRVDMQLALIVDWQLSDRELLRFDHTTLRFALNPAVSAIANAYFQEPFLVAVGASRARRQRVEERSLGLPLHQDAGSGDYGTSLGLTVFFPLNGCGGDYPSLEVLPERVSELLPQRTVDWYCDETVTQSLAPRLWAPDLAAGDAVVFDSYCPHRTQFGPGASKERLSCDMRLFGRSSAPRRLSAMVPVE
jgi:hypothetical protein